MIEFIHTSAMTRIAFHVPGVPVPQGSKRAVRNKYSGKAMMIESAGERHKDWRARVSSYAMEARNTAGYLRLDTAMPWRVSVVFAFARPKAHYRTGKNAHLLKDSAPKHHTQKPDRDKLLRAVCDSMSGILFADDSQIVCGPCVKVWADGCDPGAWIVVEPQEGFPAEARMILDAVTEAGRKAGVA